MNSRPFTPIPGVAGEMGRTPVPVAKSTHQLGQETFTPSESPGEERLEQEGRPSGPMRCQGELDVEVGGAHEDRGPEWALTDPFEPRQPPGEGDASSGLPSQTTKEQGGRFYLPEHPTPEQ